MRILITDFFGIMAGSSYSALYLAEGLANCGHDVWVACRENSFLEGLIKGSKIEAVPFRHTGKFNLFSAYKLALFVKAHDIEVVNAQASPDRYLTIFARWFFGMKAKLLHTRRQKPEMTGGRLKAWFYTRGTNKIIAVSEGVKSFLTTSGVPPGHTEVIHNGIPEIKWKNLDPDKIDSLKEKYGIKDKELVIGCVARIKKQEQILKALQLTTMPTKVFFVGIEDTYPHLTVLIEKLKEQHQVYFTGEISNIDALHYYPLFHVMVLPSDMEGFSQSILEAMVLEVPVIATHASGNPDIIQHGENGFLYRDNDIDQLAYLIKEIFNNPQLSVRIVNKAQKIARESYSMENVVRKYQALISSLK